MIKAKSGKMSHIPFTFRGSEEGELVGRIELPAVPPRAWAVFAHCFACGGESLAAVWISRALADHGIGVLRYDFAGIGRSGGTVFAGVTADVRDLAAAVAAMNDAGMPVSLLIGHSLGGIAAVETAVASEGIRAVVTIGTPSSADHLAGIGTRHDRFEAGGVVTVGGRSIEVAPGFVDDLALHPLAPSLSTSRVPILILHAPTDEVVGIEHASRIYAAARHPKSFVCLSGADHLLTRREDASYAASVISAWVAPYVAGSLDADPGKTDQYPRSADALTD